MAKKSLDLNHPIQILCNVVTLRSNLSWHWLQVILFDSADVNFFYLLSFKVCNCFNCLLRYHVSEEKQILYSSENIIFNLIRSFCRLLCTRNIIIESSVELRKKFLILFSNLKTGSNPTRGPLSKSYCLYFRSVGSTIVDCSHFI